MECGSSKLKVQGNRVVGAAERAGLASPVEGVGGREVMLVPVLAGGSLKLAESLAQAGTVAVACPKQHQNQQQKEAEEQPCGQGAGFCGVRSGLNVGSVRNSIPWKEQRAGSEVNDRES